MRVQEDKEIGVSYIRGKYKVIVDSGVTIDRKVWDKLSAEEIRQTIMNNSTNERTSGFDWKYAVTTGRLRKKPDRGNPARGLLDTEIDETPEEETSRESLLAATSRKRREEKTATFTMIEFVMLAVGIGCAIMSAYHTHLAQVLGGRSEWVSWFTGVVMILFTTTAFTASRVFFYEGTPFGYLFSGIFIVMAFLIIAYSLFSTLTVNFIKYQDKDYIKVTVAEENDRSLIGKNERVKDLEQEIEDRRARVKVLESDAAYWQNMSWRRYDGIQKDIQKELEAISSLRERLSAVKDDVSEIREEAEGFDVYSFFSKLFGVDKKRVRFFIYIIPALSYDVFAPFALSAVFYLEDKRRRKKKKVKNY